MGLDSFVYFPLTCGLEENQLIYSFIFKTYSLFSVFYMFLFHF